MFEDISDVRSFLTNICESSQFLCGVDRFLFVSVGGWGFVRFYWKGVVV